MQSARNEILFERGLVLSDPTGIRSVTEFWRDKGAGADDREMQGRIHPPSPKPRLKLHPESHPKLRPRQAQAEGPEAFRPALAERPRPVVEDSSPSFSRGRRGAHRVSPSRTTPFPKAGRRPRGTRPGGHVATSRKRLETVTGRGRGTRRKPSKTLPRVSATTDDPARLRTEI